MSHEHRHEILSEEDKAFIREKFEKEMISKVPIKLLVSDDCEYCHMMEELLSILAELSNGKIELNVEKINDEWKDKLKLDKGPVILIGENEEVQYTGSPLGEEGWAFLETIILVSNKKHGLDNHMEKLKNLSKKIRIETVVTPTCPYCPHAVLTANRIAVASNGKVVSDCIEAYEFPEIADKWNVTAVPTVIISVEEPYSGEVFVVGVPRENQLIEAITKIASGE